MTVVKFPDLASSDKCQPGDPNVIFPADGDILNVGVPVDIPMGDLGFQDIGAAFNMRDWLQKACEAQGAKMVGGGFGFGQADIDIELEGYCFNISIRPL